MPNFCLRIFGLELFSVYASTEDESTQYDAGLQGGQFERADIIELGDDGEAFGFRA